MKQMYRLGQFAVLLLVFVRCTATEQDKSKVAEKDYIFFLHNRFLEDFPADAQHPEYGRAEYKEILDSLAKDNVVVFSEKRPAQTDVKKYARKITSQIDSLLKTGVQPNHITVIGTSKGGYIAQYVSTYLANPDVNYVFIGCYQDVDIQENSDINFCGNILSIYEKSDEYGVSSVKRKETSSLKVSRFSEIELTTNLKHGFLYKPLPEWITPCRMWAKRNYLLKNPD